MKVLALVLFCLPTLGFATTVEYREVARLKACEAELEMLIAEVRWFYRDDRAFVVAFDTSQKKWEEYCAAVLEARFPAKNKQKEYGSVFEIAYALVKIGLVESRIEEISLWRDGTEEGDVSKGSVKLKNELDEIRPRKQTSNPES